MRILVAGVLLAGLGVFAYFRLVPDVELPPPPPLDREAALELPEGKGQIVIPSALVRGLPDHVFPERDLAPPYLVSFMCKHGKQYWNDKD